MKYQKPDPIGFLREDFPCGTIVENIGYRAKVIGYQITGKLLILENEEIGRWVADPMKCTRPIQRPVKPQMPTLIIG